MLEGIIAFDRDLFLFINGHYNDFFDFLMYWISNRLIWIPFYLVLALLLLKVYNKQFFFMLFFIGILIAISDQVSVMVKDYILRPRPCHDVTLEGMVHLVKGHCGGKYGFVSSHASNVFALITFLYLACNAKVKWLKFVMLPWAVLVSFSRVYLGNHFPLDIAGGMILGIITGILVYYFYVLVAQSKRGPIKFH